MKKSFFSLFKRENREGVYALQRSEILDENTCNFCLSMDGRVIDIKDEFASIDLFCKNCRGIWVQIMKEESEPPEIDGIPDEIRRCYDFKSKRLTQPLRPIVKQDSLAFDEVKRRS
jgi:hypothetical protein